MENSEGLVDIPKFFYLPFLELVFYNGDNRANMTSWDSNSERHYSELCMMRSQPTNQVPYLYIRVEGI